MAFLDKFKKKEKSEIVKKVKKPVSKELKQEKPKIITKKKDLQIYKVIKEAHITEKAGILAEQGKYVFRIYPKANKIEIKKQLNLFMMSK